MSLNENRVNDPAEIDDGRELEPIEAEELVPSWPSPLLYHRQPLTESFDELEAK